MTRAVGRAAAMLAAATGAALLVGGAWISAPARAAGAETTLSALTKVVRQRVTLRGRLALPGTPDPATLDRRLDEKDVAVGLPLYIRVFKAESELEIWMYRQGRFVHFATYPICFWSGTVGPKQREGDRQSPEGLYSITQQQLHAGKRWRNSLNIGYPNDLDKSLSRSGSYILVHGGCSSTGCFAMTNPAIEEIYGLTEKALAAGQQRIPIHVFPFRMTDDALPRLGDSPWRPFWENLKQAYDSFERTRLVPNVSVCEGRYLIEDGTPGEKPGAAPVTICPASLAAVLAWRPPAKAAVFKVARRVRSLAHVKAKAQKSKLAAAGQRCSPTRASCRKWLALHGSDAGKRSKQRIRTASR